MPLAGASTMRVSQDANLAVSAGTPQVDAILRFCLYVHDCTAHSARRQVYNRHPRGTRGSLAAVSDSSGGTPLTAAICSYADTRALG